MVDLAFWIKDIVFFLLLGRTVYTDITERKIENWIIILIFVNRFFPFLLNYQAVNENEATGLSTGLLACLFLLLIYYSFGPDTGAGDIKLLIVCILYVPTDKLIIWLFLLIGILLMYLLVLAVKKQKMNQTFPLAPFVFLTSALLYVHNYFQG